MPFATATLPITPFTISHTPQEITDLKTLLRLSPLGPETYENNDTKKPANYGVPMSSMRSIRDAWLAYDWESTQDRLNSLPQFIAEVRDRDPRTGKEETRDVHFLGYESGVKGATAVVLLHGWPGMGAFELEPMVEVLRKNAKRPLDIIIPRYVTDV
jgi:microsomal epoxide hydrolase